MPEPLLFLRKWGDKLLLLTCLVGCSMPLPRDIETPPVLVPDAGVDSPLTAFISSRTGRYSEGLLNYLDLSPCPADRCINRLPNSLSPLLRYEFFFSDKTSVLGQRPVFSSLPPDSSDPISPFRRIIQVTVPDGYQPNTLQSSEDVINSGFRTEATNRVENNPLISEDLPTSPTQVRGVAWSDGEPVTYLELGTVPYSSPQNRLGVGVVYFMRNRDKTDLPSRPLPIFDSVPGDLLYSPIRQVFRAVSESQVETLNDDPAADIRSQEDLLRAVNAGQFQLEDTQEYFNYPVVSLNSSPNLPPGAPQPTAPVSQARFDLVMRPPERFPLLPDSHYYALWVTNRLNQARLLLQFRTNASGSATLLNGTPLDLQSSIFRFSNAEVGSFRQFLVTIENEQVTAPTGSTLLQAPYAGRVDTRLETPFNTTYSSLQNGTFMLVAPTDLTGLNQRSGLWFVQRTDQRSDIPLSINLDPGVVLSLPPRGWIYNGWVRNSAGGDLWLETGRFKAINQPDNRSVHYDPSISAYPYPGEDFLRNAPQGLFFPLNLPSTGEREVVLSLEPENIDTERPFFSLYRQIILKGTPPLINQALPFPPVNFPTLNLRLERVSDDS